MQPISLLKKKYHLIWKILWSIFLLPFLYIIWHYQNNSLGINPLQTLERFTGKTALIFLILTLSITPARHYLAKLCTKVRCTDGKRLADWNWLMRTRRMVGMYCFFYASIHLSIYLYFDLALEWEWLISDIEEKPFIIAGVFSFLLLLPLALTSTNNMMRRLGKNWRRIHKLIYLIAISVIIHFWWLSKVGVYDALPYTLSIIFLLAYRVLVKFKIINPNPADDGMETDEKNRTKNQTINKN